MKGSSNIQQLLAFNDYQQLIHMVMRVKDRNASN